MIVLNLSPICKHSYAQDGLEKGYFRSPLDISLFLSGNFGEMRTNHFHTGLDIKTAGVEGQKVRASADGFVSRIKKSPWGYGNVLYVEHPNGYTTVYAHLSKFNKDIEAFYKSAQKKKKTYSLDLYPGPSMLPVKKGDLIALSGNSGSSGGPHLHFEIRETKTENPLNPLLYGFDIKDNIPPRIQGIRVYSFPNDSMAGKAKRSHAVIPSAGTYKLRNEETINLLGYGTYGLAVHTTDMLNGSGNICGVFNIKLYLDNELIYEHVMDGLDFYTNRYMNSHTDYALFRESKKSYHKCFNDPNNKLEIYETVKNRGLFEINDLKVHKVRYEIRDVHGNLSKLNFTIQNKQDSKVETVPLPADHIKCCSASEYIQSNIQYFFPEGTVYNNTPIDYSVSEAGSKWIHSPKHHINSTSIPVQQYYTINIKSDVPEELGDKAVVVEEDRGRLYAQGGRYKNGWVKARVRSFGTHYVMLDTVPPLINFTNVYEGRRFSSRTMYITAPDNLSGTKDYNAFINDNWAPAEYNSKKGRYEIKMSDISLPTGDYTLRFEAKDERGNYSSKQVNFTR